MVTESRKTKKDWLHYVRSGKKATTYWIVFFYFKTPSISNYWHFCWVRLRCRKDWPGEIVERSHAETGHHRTFPLFGQQFLTHTLFIPQRLFHLRGSDGKVYFRMWYFRSIFLVLVFSYFSCSNVRFSPSVFLFLPGPGGREQQRCSVLGSLCVLGSQDPRISPQRPCTGSAATEPLGHLTAAQ